MAKAQYGGAWPRVRKAILERDGYVCQIRGPKCKGAATQVDHIVPVSHGGQWWEPANLRASCAPCNYARIDRTRIDRWRQSRTRVILVVGPPGPHKRQHVESHRMADDLVVDYDAIAEALGGIGGPDGDGSFHAATNAARNAVINAIRRGEVEAPRAWIISSNPAAEQMFPWHEVAEIDAGIDATLAAAAGKGEEWSRLIRDWYSARAGISTSQAVPSRDW